MGVRRIILSNLGVLAAGLATLELVFGNWLSLHNINLLNLRKDLTVTFDAADLYEDPDSTIVTYKRDRYGLRGPYQDVSQIDILTIGGSTTDQRCLSEGRTWQDVLAREFEEREREIQIANAGVDGQTTRGNLKTSTFGSPPSPTCDLGLSYSTSASTISGSKKMIPAGSTPWRVGRHPFWTSFSLAALSIPSTGL